MQITTDIGLTIDQARRPQPLIWVLLQQLRIQQRSLNFGAGDMFGQRFFSSVKRHHQLSLAHRSSEQIQYLYCVQLGRLSVS